MVRDAVKEMDLKELERKAFRSTFQDGLWDIYLGLILAAMAIGVLLSDIGVPASNLWQELIYIAMMGFSILVLIAGKKFITTPRIGLVKFGPKRKRKINLVRVVLTISVLMGLLAWVFASQMGKGSLSELASWNLLFPVGWAINVLIVLGLVAYFLDFSRLYVIAVLYAIAIPLNEVLAEYAQISFTGAIAFGIPGLIILCMGTVVFSRFLKEYPLPIKEPSQEALSDKP